MMAKNYVRVIKNYMDSGINHPKGQHYLLPQVLWSGSPSSKILKTVSKKFLRDSCENKFERANFEVYEP